MIQWDSIDFARGNDLRGDGAIIPEDVMHARLQCPQYFLAGTRVVQQRGGMRAGARHALNMIEGRETVLLQKRVDLFVGDVFFYIAKQQVGHDALSSLSTSTARSSFV
ncbi:hypothetical protein PT2222_430037 [Paraburkholderia tropica]